MHVRSHSILVWACILGAALQAAAGPAEDHAQGVTAYRTGDVTGAISILRKPADAGYAPSQALLAHILDSAESSQEALKYYRLAASQGDADAWYGLAVMLADGSG